ncbi:hypothetical protein [Chelativorans sp. Marseille-P2723]|uniref:hypothetical protein n=1 Tax=Chelativorans sp. Marseille-P2723 TaxID=2709133 RepID=UPI001570038C|nr:hypothetical protein [Chelativorans sp. Marseille-P2723]
MQLVILLDQLSDDDADLFDVAIIADQNRNGLADPGEVELLPGSSVSLLGRAKLGLIVTFRMPRDAVHGARAALRLVAEAGGLSSSAVGTAILTRSGRAQK